MQTIEATIDKAGRVRLLSEIRLPEERRALLTILDEEPLDTPDAKKERLFAAFEELAKRDIFPTIDDPVKWQRKLRDEWE
jgi:hypothetical protein